VPLHILITDLALRPSSHAGHDNGVSIGAQLSLDCSDWRVARAQISCRTGLASCPPLTRCRPRFAILAALGRQRRLQGMGSPSQHHPWRVIPKTGSSRIGGTRRSRCDVCLTGVCRSDRAENSHTAGGSETSFPPAPSMSLADCGSSRTREDHV
jgi:hypothetical protein